MKIWIGWDGRHKFLYLFVSCVIMVLLLQRGTSLLSFSKDKVLSLTCLLLTYSITSEIGWGTISMFFVPFAVIVLLKNRFRIECLHYIVKWFAILLIPCIITYFFVQFLQIPSLGKVYYNHEDYNIISYVARYNYIFYVYSDFYNIRFNGPFLEPGHLGMMSAFLLFADGFNLKKWATWVILFALLLTLSLAGYVLCLCGYVFAMYLFGRLKLKKIYIFLVILGLLYFCVVFYDGGNNLLNEKILSRLDYDAERGFSGNNRVDLEAMTYYYSLFNNEKLLLFGYGKGMYRWLAEQGHGGTGIYMCMIQYGLIGSISMVAFYIFYAFTTHNRRISILFLVFVLMLFWQRTYSFWHSWLICFVYGITNFQYKMKYKARF